MAATPDRRALSATIAADPRVQAYIAANRRGNLPVWLDAALLRTFGYEVPDDWKYSGGGGRIQPGLIDENDKWDKIIGTAAAVGGTAGTALAFAPAATLGGYGAAVPTTINAAGVPVNMSVASTAGIAPVVAGGGGALDVIKKAAGSLSARDWLGLATKGFEIGTNIWGANKASDASKEAAEIEAAAYREGLAFLTKQWEKYNDDFKPYLDAGHAAVGRMSGALEGTTPPPMPASVSARLNGKPTLGTFGQPQPRPTTQTAPPQRPTIERPPGPPVSTTMPVPSPSGPPLRDPGEPDSLGNFGQPPVSTTMPVVGGQPKLVRVQAPDGEVREMPEQMANAFIARGAKRVQAA